MRPVNAMPPMPPFGSLHLRGRRLDLLPITRHHAAPMFEVLKDIALYEFTGGTPPADVEALDRRFRFWENRRSPDGSELWFNWVLQERECGALLGHLQASVNASRADIAWVVGSRWQNCGYASEAAQVLVKWLLSLGMREIRASIHPAHHASIKVAERAGLQRTNNLSGSEIIWELRVDTRTREVL